MGGLDEDTTLALYFEMAQSGGQQQQQAGRQRYMQLLTSYQHSSGQYRLRVTTLARPWAEAAQAGEIARGFDQEAAAVLMARYATHKTHTEESFEILRCKLPQYRCRLGCILVIWVAFFSRRQRSCG